MELAVNFRVAIDTQPCIEWDALSADMFGKPIPIFKMLYRVCFGSPSGPLPAFRYGNSNTLVCSGMDTHGK